MGLGWGQLLWDWGKTLLVLGAGTRGLGVLGWDLVGDNLYGSSPSHESCKSPPSHESSLRRTPRKASLARYLLAQSSHGS